MPKSTFRTQMGSNTAEPTIPTWFSPEVNDSLSYHHKKEEREEISSPLTELVLGYRYQDQADEPEDDESDQQGEDSPEYGKPEVSSFDCEDSA